MPKGDIDAEFEVTDAGQWETYVPPALTSLAEFGVRFCCLGWRFRSA
jgi:hypothetical protein